MHRLTLNSLFIELGVVAFAHIKPEALEANLDAQPVHPVDQAVPHKFLLMIDVCKQTQLQRLCLIHPMHLHSAYLHLCLASP
jgi:hypothetical protein